MITYNFTCQNADIEHDINIFTGNITNDLSDHLVNYISLPYKFKTINYENREHCRILSLKNKQLFSNTLSSTDWTSEIYNLTDPNEAYDRFYDIILSIFDRCFPIKRVSRKRYKDKLWMTTGEILYFKTEIVQSIAN